ncbi:hypothetical protein ACFORG_18945 [Lutimaribacter marinistellae]|uniref:3-methyladenine DNA glycosylase AlkC n=1 Tax=Lutimaribacter marinistellae TaxID=1820329 RepID=A0ABV7TNP5_9RHOB
MAAGDLLKDQLFNAEKVRSLSARFAAADPSFDHGAFETAVMSRLPELELKARMDWIATCLAEAVPGPLERVGPIILRALPPPCDPTLSDGDFGDFIYAPLGEWVAARGGEEPDRALDLIEEITQRFSMEWAIRPLLNDHPETVLARMESWVGHPHYHVRRLVSEGTRPRLPWGQGVDLAVSTPLPLLDRLHADPTRYVTRSVANHLNDVTRNEPDLVIDRLGQWGRQGRQKPDELTWMARHALRGLVKSGHPDALRHLGFDPDAQITADLRLNGSARIGGALDFTVSLIGPKDTPVLVDYIIHFRRPGGRISAKTHKLKQARLSDTELVLEKRHKLKGDATTFRLVPGTHRIEVQVNGRVRAEAAFDLLDAAEERHGGG